VRVVQEVKIDSFSARDLMSQPGDGKGITGRRFCHNCGIQVSIGVKYFSNCGSSQTALGLHSLAVIAQLPAAPAGVAKGKREFGAVLIIALLGFSAFVATVMVQLDVEVRRLESESKVLRAQFMDARNPTTPVGPNQLRTPYPAGGALYVEALLEKNPYSATATMLVDTGADISLAPARLATDLQIDLYSGSQITLRGLFGGEGTAYVHSVNVKPGNLRTAQIEIAIATTDTVPYVLGRQGFLAQFDLKTDQDSGVFCIVER